jgi:hypothetical protein
MRLQPSRWLTDLALAIGLALAVRPATLAAQGGSIKPVSVDTIYRLAVDSAGYKDYAFVYLLDDGIVRVESDGRGTERYHQVVQILKPEGVEPWAERQFAYRPGHSKVKVNWMRVVRPSGELVSDKPSISQESTMGAGMADPVYSDTKVIRYSLSGVAVGTLVDISWTTETTDPYLKGEFLHGWSTTMAYPALRSRYAVDIPASMTPRIVETHLDFKRSEEQAGGRHLYFWEKRQSMPVKGELFAPDSSVPRTSITVGSPLHWADVAGWYAGLAKDRYTLSPKAVAKIDSIVRTQHTASDTIEALHRWIAKDIRYVSVALGMGGYQPRLPDSTISTKLGDCKDKATLFIAAAKHLGLTAYPVLLNSNGAKKSEFVSISLFDHAIAAMPRADHAGYTFLDLTTDAVPPGEVSPSYQGGFGLVILSDAKSEEVTFPEDSPGGSRTTFEGEVDADGKVSGHITYTSAGLGETAMRMAFREPMDSARRANMQKSIGRTFPSARADSVSVFDARNPKSDARVTASLHGGEAFKRVGSVGILSIPDQFQGAAAQMRYMSGQLAEAPERKYPIDASLIVASSSTKTEMKLTLPDGWKAQLPKAFVATSVFGEYRAEYSQEGRVLRIAHSLTGAKAIYPKDRLAELRTWLKAIADDNVDSIVLMPTPVP